MHSIPCMARRPATAARVRKPASPVAQSAVAPPLRWRHWAMMLACVGLGVPLGIALKGAPKAAAATEAPPSSNPAEPEHSDEKLEFVRHLVDCSPRQEAPADGPVKAAVAKAIEDAVVRGRATGISVSYRDLTRGGSFVIHPELRFVPASLLKLPMTMAWMRYSSFESEVLGRQLKAKKVSPTVQRDGEGVTLENPQLSHAPVRLEAGKDYSVLELLGRSLIESDNDAANLLGENLPDRHVEHVFGRFGFDLPIADGARVADARKIGRMFIALYNGTYNTAEASDHLLRLLSRSRMRHGLVAGVPEGVKVAHKFGVDFDSTRADNELHDCGVVYAETGHYMLCVMTRGEQTGALAEVIAGISKATWQAHAAKTP